MCVDGCIAVDVSTYILMQALLARDEIHLFARFALAQWLVLLFPGAALNKSNIFGAEALCGCTKEAGM